MLDLLQFDERRSPTARGLVFHGADGSPLNETWLDQQHAVARTLLKLPEERVLHSCRHTFGTRLGETGADAFTIMRLMGHSTVLVSQRYVHPSPVVMENAISRMEAYNTAIVQGVGTKSDTLDIARMPVGSRAV